MAQLALVALALTASTGGSHAVPSASAQLTKQGPASALPKAANTPALRKAITVDNCNATANGWEAKGTAGNRRSTAIAYLLTVYFTSSKATVLGYTQTTVTVPASGSVHWIADHALTPQAGTRCVLVGVAAAPVR